MKALILAEKVSLQRIISETYNKYRKDFNVDYDFVAFNGHVVGLKEPREYDNDSWKSEKWYWEMLPINPSPFEYKITSKKFNEIKKILENGHYDYIVNACDPEREGNHIFHLFYMYSGCKLPYKRFWTNELADEAVKKALLNLRYEGDGKLPDLKRLTNTALLRAWFDYLVGMNVTIACSLAMSKTAKIGRVKTPTQFIVCKREEEIANFKSTTRYELSVNYIEKFSGTLFDKDGNISFVAPTGFNDIKSKLGKTAIVTSMDKKQEKTNPPSLFNLSGLQSAASKEYGYDINSVLEIAQSLYEKKVLSYPRTDCTAIGSETAKQFSVLLKSVSSYSDLIPYINAIPNSKLIEVSNNKNYVNDAALAEGGHYALIPTSNAPNWNQLTEMEANILKMVYKRFFSIFMPPVLTNKMQVITTNNGFTFKSSGKTVIDKGWQVLYNVESKDTMLPPLNKGDVVNVKNYEVKDITTKPPKRYTDGDLVELMANPIKFLEDEGYKDVLKGIKGIGTEATRANIILDLFKSGYIEAKAGKGKTKLLYATPLGMTIYQNFKKFDFAKVDMTGIWETKLAQVQTGNLNPPQFEKEMREYVLNQIDIIKNATDIKKVSYSDTAKSIGICPKCNIANVVEGKSYFFCQKYKNGCDFIIPKNLYGAKITTTEVKKILARKETKPLEMSIIDKATGKKKEWTCPICYNPEKQGIDFVRKQKGNSSYVSQGTPIGLCPKCKKEQALYHGSCCKCDGPNGCGWFVSSNLKGTTFTKEEFKKLFDGEIVNKKFTWTSGKSSNANVKLENERINFLFEQKK